MIERWGVFEARFPAPEDATFTYGDRTVRVPGFSDGDGTYVVRFSPDVEGEWAYTTTSGHSGTFDVVAPSPGNHGPVGVAGGGRQAGRDLKRAGHAPSYTRSPYQRAYEKPHLTSRRSIRRLTPA